MVAAIVVILAVIGGGIWLWVHRNRHAEVRQEQQGPSASGALKEQLKAQVPILLQLCDSVMTVSSYIHLSSCNIFGRDMRDFKR